MKRIAEKVIWAFAWLGLIVLMYCAWITGDRQPPKTNINIEVNTRPGLGGHIYPAYENRETFAELSLSPV